jgi:hypothetical protein
LELLIVVLACAGVFGAEEHLVERIGASSGPV